ncbi:MAG TPA: NAD(P)-binding domain-containing protein [Candidatus Dormibacteraeota bacterium]
MRIAVIGTGVVGRTVAARLAELGHDVVVGTRDPSVTRERTQPDRFGTAFSTWLEKHAGLRLETFEAAAAHAELVVNATSGLVSLDALASAGAANLDGKILVDIANALDFSKGMPPAVRASSEESLAERIQTAFPGAHVVKTLNTMNAFLMVDPAQLAGGDHTVFLSGNDASAKARVSELLRSFGWRDIIDLGELSTARGTELLLPIWLSLMSALGIPPSNFQFKIVR